MVGSLVAEVAALRAQVARLQGGGADNSPWPMQQALPTDSAHGDAAAPVRQDHALGHCAPGAAMGAGGGGAGVRGAGVRGVGQADEGVGNEGVAQGRVHAPIPDPRLVPP